MRINPEIRTNSYIEIYESGQYPGGTYDFLVQDYYRGYASSNTPGYPRIKRVNGYEMYEIRFSSRPLLTVRRDSIPGQIGNQWDVIHYVYRPGTFSGPSDGLIPGVLVPLYEAQQDAIGKAMDATKDMKINIAQALAERKEVDRMIGQTATRLAKAFLAVKKGRFGDVRSILGYKGGPRKQSSSVANDWLAFQYGWKPLLSDIKGGAEYLAKRNLEQRQYVVARGTSRASAPQNGQMQSVIGAVAETADDLYESKARCQLRFTVTNEALRIGSETGITDPLLLAWELVPYSFVVDWMLPVGDFLSRLNYDSGLQFVDGFSTILTKRNTTVTLKDQVYIDVNGLTCQHTGGVAVKTAVTHMLRTTMSGPPRPVLPGFKDPFSPVHTLNGIALLRNAFKK